MTLREVIEQNLFKCVARRLDRAPHAEDMPFTIVVMEEDLRAHGVSDNDAARVDAAFRKIGPTLQRWPTAPMVIVAMPKRESLVRLERKKTPEEWQRMQARIGHVAALARDLANKFNARKPKPKPTI